MSMIVEFRNITKEFVGTRALDDVSFGIEKGEVHVLAGENGAGKSTLLKILLGLYHHDSGEILYKGEPLKINHPNQAIKLGIAMVYQELTVLPNMTVLDNVFLSNESERYGKLVNRKEQLNTLLEMEEKYGIYVDPYEITGSLAIAVQQKVEILKILSGNPEVIILDEPTSVLPKEEVEVLFDIIRNLIKNGKTIIFISHRMEEIFEIGNKVTVLKDGRWVATKNIKDTSVDDIIQCMIGRELKDIYPQKGEIGKEILYEVEDISYGDKVKNISFNVHIGEIVGIAGLQGHGQTELLRVLSGNLSATKGVVRLKGKPLDLKSPRSAINNGVGYVPENRKEQALFPELSVRVNMSMSSMKMRKKRGFLDLKKEKEFVNKNIKQFSVKTSGQEQQIVRLSGGNQQKVIIGKVLATNPQVLLFNEPTRGIDVQTKYEIYKLMRTLAKQGVAVVVYSSDMMEVIGLSDKVIVMYEGEVTNVLCGSEIAEDEIMASAVGAQRGDVS